LPLLELLELLLLLVLVASGRQQVSNMHCRTCVYERSIHAQQQRSCSWHCRADACWPRLLLLLSLLALSLLLLQVKAS
jgi:hypothetical protein